MKTRTTILALIGVFFSAITIAQDRTTVTANSDDISDNLDLRAIASVFGDSENLEDFERRLNDPELRISNLDLNGDNRVDYLRVIESVEGTAHLIIIQAVIGPDLYQDVATIEVEKDSQNQPRVLVVGDVFMYGDNYIYEPVYYQSPLIYNYFWSVGYRPYFSSWYWGYYPTYFAPWAPFPVYSYVNFINIHLNHQHYYNCISYRPHSHRAYLITRPVRGNAFATMHPNRSFAIRHSGIRNRQDLDNIRRDNPRRNIPSNRNELSPPRQDQNRGREQQPSRTNTRPRTESNLNNRTPSRTEFTETSGRDRQVSVYTSRPSEGASVSNTNSNNSYRATYTSSVKPNRSTYSIKETPIRNNENSQIRVPAQPQRSFSTTTRVKETPKREVQIPQREVQTPQRTNTEKTNQVTPRFNTIRALESGNSGRRGSGGR